MMPHNIPIKSTMSAHATDIRASAAGGCGNRTCRTCLCVRRPTSRQRVQIHFAAATSWIRRYISPSRIAAVQTLGRSLQTLQPASCYVYRRLLTSWPAHTHAHKQQQMNHDTVPQAGWCSGTQARADGVLCRPHVYMRRRFS
jgi:hypothetical protein